MLRTTFALALAAALSACALTTDYVDISYQPAGTAAPVDGAAAAKVAVKATDARTSHLDRVGSKKNGFGAEMAPIVSNTDIVETTRRAIESELAARGFSIGDGGATVLVEVANFYNDFKPGFFSGDAVAEIALNVKVGTSGRPLAFSKLYAASGREPNIQLASGENAQAALNDGLRNVIAKVVGDPELIAALLRPRPAAGTPTS
jgi:uncharacterized lipoprotein